MLTSKGYLRSAVIIAAFIILGLSFAFAVEDGFGEAKKVEGKYFTVYYFPETDIFKVIEQLNISPSINPVFSRPPDKEYPIETRFTDTIDALYLQVCDILDMHIYSFHGNIKICRDINQVKQVYKSLFDDDIKMSAFYVYDLNTIYISEDSFKCGILGHEIGHAVISRYFVVLPSIKVQELLATYVEFQLCKDRPK